MDDRMTQLESGLLPPMPVTSEAQCLRSSAGVSIGGGNPEVESTDMERGWFKVWRKLEDSQIWSHSVNMRSLWLTLLMRANHKEAWWKGQQLKPGELACSWATLASDSLLTIKQTRYCADLLADWGKIARKVTGNWQVISVCKWDIYQNRTQESGRRVAGHGQASGRPVATDKNEENNKNGNNPDHSPSGETVTNAKRYGKSSPSESPSESPSARTLSPSPSPSLSPELSQKKISPPSGGKPSKATWLTPYWDAWAKRFKGGELPAGKFLAALKEYEVKYGVPKAVKAWIGYLEELEGPQFSSPSTFTGAGPDHWIGNKTSPSRKPTGMSMADLDKMIGDRVCTDQTQPKESHPTAKKQSDPF